MSTSITLPLWALGLLSAAGLYLLSSLVSFYKNYQAARNMGIPVICSPVAQSNVLWMIFGPMLTPILCKAPYGLGSWVHYTRYMWIWEDQGEMHRKLGKVFAHVSPGLLELYVADLAVIREVYARRKDFEKGEATLDHMPVLITPSVSAVVGADWQRHRRITAPPFNESNMTIVWHDSLRQARDMSQWWSSRGDQGFKSSGRDTMTMALNVLAAAGLGLTWDFTPAQQKAGGEDDFSASYRDNLAPLITDIILLALTPKWLYQYGPKLANFLPQYIREHVLKAQTFRGLMRQLVEDRKASMRAGNAKDNIFLNAMLASSLDPSQQGVGTDNKNSTRSAGLSEDELFANIVDYNIAGHETTAHTLNYCFHILTVEPQWQDWIQEEVDHVLTDLPLDTATLDYGQLFPRLKRCLALMLEMLRVYPPVLMQSKESLAPKGQGHELHLDGRTIFVPGGAVINLENYSVQLMSEYWGPDSHEWRPTRWIQQHDNKEESLAELLKSEVIAPPPIAKESFFPWSSGARDCPGKKFAQVEFVAVMAYVLRHYRVEAVPLEGETFQDTRKRIWDYTRDSVAQLTINFREPDKYALRLVERP